MRVTALAAAVMLASGPAAAAPGPAPGSVDVTVRFEVEGVPMPGGTTFPRLPAGLKVTLLPEVHRTGDGAALGADALAGLHPRWHRLEPVDPVTSNLQRRPDTGEMRLAATPLRHRRLPVPAPDPWRVDADLLARVGTVRFEVELEDSAGVTLASTSGPECQYELSSSVPGGLCPRVYGLTRRPGEDLAGVAGELEGVPFVFNPLGDAPVHQTERRVGLDCTSTFIYAMRRLGHDLTYFGPTQVWPYLTKVASGLRARPDGIYVDEAGREVSLGNADGPRPGDLLHFGTQLSLLVQDRWPFGVLDEHDLLLQAWRSSPHRVTIHDSEYAGATATVVRFAPALPRTPALVARVEDSHAGSFFHLLPAVRGKQATLVLLDAHSDAGQHLLSSELVHHEPTAAWLDRLRADGTIQPYDWIDALLPWGVERAMWLGPWDEHDRAADERQARADLCALSRWYPNDGFVCRAAAFRTATADEVVAAPPPGPTVLSVDLDFLLREDGAVSLERARDVARVAASLRELTAVSVALSRPYIPDDATFARALRLLSVALHASGAVSRIEVDLRPVQHDDRSKRVAALRAAGESVPVVRPEQIESTPGLALVGAAPHATFGLVGDVYRSRADEPLPAAFAVEPRPGGFGAPERVPLVLNLETPVDDAAPAQGHPRFNQAPALLDALASWGVLVVSLANNHALDRGQKGLEATVRAARARGLGVVGAWLPGEPARGVERVRIGDLRVAFLGVTARSNEAVPASVGFDLVPFEDYPQGPAARAAEDAFLAKVRAVSASADLVVVLVHGGVEYAPGPSTSQRRFFAALTSAGARVVAGAHSHLAGPFEVRDGALLAWGLGDALPAKETSGLGLVVTAERGAHGVDVRATPMARAQRR